MKAYTIYIGLTTRWGEDLCQTMTEDDILALISGTLKGAGIAGATVFPARGMWRGKDEAALTLYISAEDLQTKIETICGTLASDFDQAEVGFHESPVLCLVPNPNLS